MIGIVLYFVAMFVNRALLKRTEEEFGYGELIICVTPFLNVLAAIAMLTGTGLLVVLKALDDTDAVKSFFGDWW